MHWAKNYSEIMKAEALIEETFEWKEWIDKIPHIPFKSNWQVQVIPPFAGAIARFRVKNEKEISCSVYLDCYNRLGAISWEKDTPYWEVYPVDDDIERCAMNEVDELIAIIEKSLGEKE